MTIRAQGDRGDLLQIFGFSIGALVGLLFLLNAAGCDQQPPVGKRGITLTTPTQIELAWDDVSEASLNEDGFEIERAEGTSGNFVKVGEVAQDVTTFRDTGLTPATGYCYRARAFLSSGPTYSAYSNTACGTTLREDGTIVDGGLTSGDVDSGVATGDSDAGATAGDAGVTHKAKGGCTVGATGGSSLAWLLLLLLARRRRA